MTIVIVVATKPETCFRCEQLGLGKDNIFIGQDYVRIFHEDKEACACLDCLLRLEEELLEDYK